MIPNASAAMIPQNHPLDFLKTHKILRRPIKIGGGIEVGIFSELR